MLCSTTAWASQSSRASTLRQRTELSETHDDSRYGQVNHVYDLLGFDNRSFGIHAVQIPSYQCWFTFFKQNHSSCFILLTRDVRSVEYYGVVPLWISRLFRSLAVRRALPVRSNYDSSLASNLRIASQNTKTLRRKPKIIRRKIIKALEALPFLFCFIFFKTFYSSCLIKKIIK